MKNIEDICVTIAIPVYNSEKVIADTVRSIFAQTHKNWKLILVNDGSTDKTGEWLKRIQDDRVTYINSENKGLIYWLNYFIDVADTPYYARMDADDIMHPERIEKQLRFLEENPSVDLIDSAIYTMDLETEPVGIRNTKDIDFTPSVMLNNGVLTHPSVMGRTVWFKANRYDINYYRSEDQELWCRTFETSTISRIKEPLLIYREGKVSIKNYASSIESTKKIIRNYGPKYYSPFTIKTMLLKQNMKVLIYKLFTFFSRQDILTKRRNQPLTAEQHEHAMSIITNNSKVVVPLRD
jgi:glycosyltransferase involved in cell wall biosynthesis